MYTKISTGVTSALKAMLNQKSFLPVCLAFAMVLTVGFSRISDPKPEPQQSTTGPTPPLEVIERDKHKLPDKIEYTLSEVTLSAPAYIWRHGCGPTALGMLVGYFDSQGFPDLIPGSASTQTEAVDQAIASGGSYDSPFQPGSERHYEDYARPQDGFPDLLADDYITSGRTPHGDDSIADYMNTSKSTYGNYYGWSWSNYMGPAFIGYVNHQNAGYGPSYQEYYTYNESLNWSLLTNEINAGKPMIFLVDTGGDGVTDHFVTVIGYRTSPTQQYGMWDTWSTTIRWENFNSIANGVPWGIWGGWAFRLQEKPGAFDKVDPANGATGISTEPTLRWGSSSMAASYEYCYDTSNDNVCSRWTSLGNRTTYEYLSGLYSGTTYYWHVRAKNASGTTYSNASPTAYWSFRTAVLPGLIFEDGFETENFSRWTNAQTDRGDLKVVADLRASGYFGVRANIDDNVGIFVMDDSPNAEKKYHARFYFYPNEIQMANGDSHKIFQGYQGTAKSVLQINFRRYNDQYQVRAGIRTDSGVVKFTPWYSYSDEYGSLEVFWKASTGPGANNGKLIFWRDGYLLKTISGVDNDTHAIDRVRLGPSEGIDSGTRGIYYFDEFRSTRTANLIP